ncbi:MAG TPA: amidohydrolase family protein [Xanthobacteraceae bacterium]|nr:amidohydrolase family protein [Xanthobacteraceae bacterium]
MRGVSAVALTAALMLAAFGGSSVPARAQAPAVTAFEGARIIVGDGRPSIENGTLLVEGTKIAQAGAAVDVRVPQGATIVNLAGKTIMPMLIDTHTHLSQTRERLTRDLKRRAYYGVSAAMSMGTSDTDVDLQMRGETMPGMARVFTAWRGITRPEVGRTTAPFWINSEQEGRKAVQELAARKVDIVKVWVDDRDGKYAKMTPALYGAVIDEAHKDGLRVTAHIFNLEDAKGLLRAGVDAFAHSVRDRDVDDEFMTLVKQHPNLVVNPNLPDRGVKTDVSWLRASLPAAEMQRVEQANTDRPKAQEFYGIQARNLAKLSAAGVRIVLGTDGNTPWAPHVEMADMVAAGMTPAQVIVASTRNAAEFLRMSDAGTLETGKSADFIVLDANPLDDITNTRRIAAVYLRGAAVDRTKAP